MPPRSALLNAVSQQQQHLRGRQHSPSNRSPLAQVHDLKGGDDAKSLVVKDSNKLDVSSKKQDVDVTDHVIIVSGGRMHLYGTHRNLQVAGLVPGGSTIASEFPSDSPSMAPTENDVCYNVQLNFETDGDAGALSFVMYNLDDLADGVLNETIIAAQYGSLQDNTIYSPTDTVCVEKPGCYRAILFDQKGDGFAGSGLLNVTVDGVQALNVLPGDVGTDCESCEVPGTVYYFAEFGDCVVADDGSTTAPTTVVDPTASCADLDLAFVTDTQADGYVIVVLESGNFGNVLFSQNSFEPETAYGADESQICIAPGTCTEVYVFDDAGDGFEVGSGFILEVDG
ncbi:MAG: hypothetical protein SGARI_006080, partial [Bacillariaceae sp.]